MGFIGEWHKAIASDPQWQFEEIYDELEGENPELAQTFADYVQREEWVNSLVRLRMWLKYKIWID